MKLNFNDLELIWIDWEKIQWVEVAKTFANSIYIHTKDLDLVDIAMKINKLEEVEIPNSKIEELKRLINDEKIWFVAFVRKALLDFIEGK